MKEGLTPEQEPTPPSGEIQNVDEELEAIEKQVKRGKKKVEEDLSEERQLAGMKKNEGKAGLARGGKLLAETAKKDMEEKAKKKRVGLGLDVEDEEEA